MSRYKPAVQIDQKIVPVLKPNAFFADPRGDELFDWRNTVVMDTESNGLLDRWYGDDHFKFHCAWYYDIAEDEYYGFRPDEMDHFAERLQKKVVVSHNGFGFDFKAIKHVYPGWECAMEIDTLPLAKMLWHAEDLLEGDAKLWRSGKMPGEQMKRQGIEAWGYRLGAMKGDYQHDKKAEFIANGGDPRDRDGILEYTWARFNEPMYDYNKQDVVVGFALLRACLKKLNWFQRPVMRTLADGTEEEIPNRAWRTPALAVETEQLMQRYCLEAEEYGAGFDQQKAIALSGDLQRQREELAEKIVPHFKPWWQAKGDIENGTVPAKPGMKRKRPDLPDVRLPRYSEKTGKRLADYVGPPMEEVCGPFVPITFTQFSLTNRHHLAQRLMAVYGWKPKAFGGAKGTDPVIDEATIKDIPDSVLAPDLKQAILDYYVVDKTYKTLADGTKAWLKLYDEDTGTIHGRIDPLGTITHRGAHSNPNLGNIPSVELDEEKVDGKVVAATAVLGVAGGFGHECRELFIPRRPFDTQVGTDMYALELFMLGHYLYPYDGGEFARRISTPGLDIHQENANLIGLPRKDTKTTTYKTLYGSGAEAIGVDVWVDQKRADKEGRDPDDLYEWMEAPGVKAWVSWQKREQGDLFSMPSKQRRAWYGKGYMAKQKLLNGITGLKDFISDVKEKARERGYIIGIDGRRLSVRKEFAALNALLQASGSIACKVWIITHRRMLEAQGLRALVDWAMQEWVHDEQQIGTFKRHAEIVGKLSEDAAVETSRILKLKVNLQAAFKIGSDWAECH